MTKKRMITVDGNEACASVAYRANELAVIYPITPSSTMGELADQWAAEGRKNLWGVVPEITEMQSEAGAAGAVHGVIQSGALGTTFTASQGLLLMIPIMYKIAGEMTPFVMHVSARTIATHALSIFGDHSDVMATRQTGFAMLAGGSVQEAQDMAAIAQAATLRSRIPFLHFFDGFRTSHEVAKIEALEDDDLRAMLDEKLVQEYRSRSLTPDRPHLAGSAQNPDSFFQAMEARNIFYDGLPALVQEQMDHYAQLTGRAYHLFDYVGHPEAEDVIVIMGSGGETVQMTAKHMNANGRKVGVLKVHLFRPFSIDAFVSALPPTVRNIAVLDRCKEPGSVGEPLYLDIVSALNEAKASGLRPAASDIRVIGGRYGLSSKEFTPPMVKAVYDELQKAQPKPHFTVGIRDDVTNLSLDYDRTFVLPAPKGISRAVFYGLGSDGTVGANKNSIKIVADNTDLYAQAYFVYDSKKSGGLTVSHLRFSPEKIMAPYLVAGADFVACHHFVFMDKYHVLQYAGQGATFLLNAPYPADEVFDRLSRPVQQEIIDKKLKLFVIDARKVALAAGMGGRVNTIMQVCHFALTDTLPTEVAIDKIKKAIDKTYGRKSQKLVERNFAAVDQALANLVEVKIPDHVTTDREMPPAVPPDAPDFVQRVTAVMLAEKGDELPVSAFPIDGVWPTGTAQYEKRNIADMIPSWDPSLCIQCAKCALVCPHAAIRIKPATADMMANAPATMKSVDYKGPEFKGQKYIIQVAPEDCTGCSICREVCPAKSRTEPDHKSLDMVAKEPILEQEKENFKFFLSLPDVERADVRLNMKTSQMITPLFEFSGACLACGETPYIKAVTQLYGDRLMIANATGCSSIYGGNLPTTPYAQDRNGRGPAWCNSLFEDNAEFGMGMRLGLDHHKRHASDLLKNMAGQLPEKLANELLFSPQVNDIDIRAQRERVAALKAALVGINSPEARRLEELADYLVDKVVFIIGGDGWAYDIGYGGLDHVLASGKNVNILVLDTEVYSNTGGQASKSTPLGATAKFAADGKIQGKKDLGLIAMSYGNVYVASIAFGAKDMQTVKALQEAVSYDGVSLIIAYSHCIAHGIDMAQGLERQKQAVQTGYWPLYRYDPRRLGTDESPLELDAGEPSLLLSEFMENETRFKITERNDPEIYKKMVDMATLNAKRRFGLLNRLAGNDAAE